MKPFFLFTSAVVLISYIVDKEKTWAGIRKGTKMFLGLLPDLFIVLIFASLLLAITPEAVIVRLLGKESGIGGMVAAAIIGSIALIPGFIAFPLAAVLHKSGVSLDVIAVFITTLMMVGVVSLPVEKKYFGLKVTLYRNGLSLLGAIIIGLIMGLFL